MDETEDAAGTQEAFDAPTLRFYAKNAPTYIASGSNGASRHLQRFLDRLRPSARILELGCGGGRDAVAMLERGFIVDATDGTPAIALKAEERIGKPVRVMRFDQLDEVETYDAVWAHASLLHVPRAALSKTLERVHRALRPGGYHFASYKAGGVEGRDQFGRYFNYPDMAQLLATYTSAAPWEIVETDDYFGGGYDRHGGPWIAVVARKMAPTG